MSRRLRKPNPSTHTCCNNPNYFKLHSLVLIVTGLLSHAASGYWVLDGRERCRVGFLSFRLGVGCLACASAGALFEDVERARLVGVCWVADKPFRLGGIAS